MNNITDHRIRMTKEYLHFEYLHLELEVIGGSEARTPM